MVRTLAAPLILFMVALPILNACSNSKSPTTGHYVVSVPKCAFYKYGPAQSFGPDLQLAQGRQLTVLQRSFGFSHVMTDDGTTGYVATDEIKPAPPEQVTAVSQNPSPSSSKGGKSNRNNNVEPSKMPGFDMNDVPLPSTDSTPPPNGPKFRY
jgi:hypothetical protein